MEIEEGLERGKALLTTKRYPREVEEEKKREENLWWVGGS